MPLSELLAGPCPRSATYWRRPRSKEKKMNIAVAAERQSEENMILDAVDKFLETDVRPYAHDLEARDECPTEIVQKMKAMGLFGCLIEPEYGGLGLSSTIYAKIIEHISAVWMSVAGVLNSHRIMASAGQRNATHKQKQHYLPRSSQPEV